MAIADQGTAAHNFAVPDCQQARNIAALDLVDPGREHFWLADIARQEQQIMGRQFLRKREDCGFVCARHQAKFDVAGLGLDVTRIATLLAHIDLPANQESSFGHSRLIALAPATRET